MKSGKTIWLIILVMGIALRSTQLFHPVDTESWREADVSTIAKNFYINQTDILHPQVAWDGPGPGYTEGEFQLYSYLIATTYKIVGFWEPSGRMISFVFSIGAMLVFFKLSRFLLKTNEAIAASICFAVSPILTVVANTIQPESLMFFFYISSGYSFIRWLNESSKKYFWLTIICTALALLCKLTAANIGIMFLLMLLFKKGWKYFFTWQVILLGICSILPSVLWYYYCRKFYINYGNSLGLSNEYAWIGMDFFNHKRFILGIFKIEIQHVWTKAGPFILLFALLFTQWRKNKSIMFATSWYAAAFLLYLLAVRTTSADWAYYYHIFSIPSACILIGSAIIALYEGYAPSLKNLKPAAVITPGKMRGQFVMLCLATFVLYFALANIKYFAVIKNTNFKTSEYYTSRDSLKVIIPEKSLVLANGGFCRDEQGYPKAYNSSYFFYWLNRKGFNICVEDLSVAHIAAYKAKGVDFFIAEEKVIRESPGLKAQLKNSFITLYEKNGCIVFKL